ncbi:nuclear transport factor 2 family protein [Pseudenhygromyxa sp. WMMC2535]|uniref:nuclear transport factor 2 family protein n=1 Tax=Pseudenhygromyxa sp. WMMC2535 TaxID=2712867 RepID=UPI001555CFB8|nr:nuclear transport factor 2 family protein [Pseudenhygromyxa sp. WMMC2535]NVB36328.1 nuclear transport factor 2 family protein [Pseudenhygromyxa sp. WMMC2535]
MSDNATHRALIERFYTAFSQHDAEGMVACYHPQVRFSDPAFGDLDAREACGMWRMLVERGKDLKLEFSAVQAEGERGSAHWEAWYTLSTTGRKVHNVVEAELRFADGLIIEHRDRFDFHRWAKQALGPAGLLLGWTSMLQNKVKTQARAGLEDYLAKHQAS